MNNNISTFLDEKISLSHSFLLETNSCYAIAYKENIELYENIKPILERNKNIEICVGDCCNFNSFIENQKTMAKILQKELYLQGALDCSKIFQVKLFSKKQAPDSR